MSEQAERERKVADCPFCTCPEVSGRWSVAEMMFGCADRFAYNECSACGSLYIDTVPAELARYYPSNYYSFKERKPTLRDRLRRARIGFAATREGMLGRILCALAGEPSASAWLNPLGLTRSSAIVDVGCGSGALLRDLRAAGYTHLTGIDPFLEKDMEADGVQIRKLALHEFTREVDVFMFHHSLEHMENPRETFRFCRSRLRDGGKLLVRIPVAGSWACREYREHWVQLDAPRHLAIPSVAGMRTLAEQTGFTLETTVFDSHALQFYGSLRNVPPRHCTQERKSEAAVFPTAMARVRKAQRRTERTGPRRCSLLHPSQELIVLA